MSTHYTVVNSPTWGWSFTTPVGLCDGFLSESEARAQAERQKRSDRRAAFGDGPFDRVLKPYFQTK